MRRDVSKSVYGTLYVIATKLKYLTYTLISVIHAVRRVLQDKYILETECSELLCLIKSFAESIEPHHPDGSEQLVTLADQLQLVGCVVITVHFV